MVTVYGLSLARLSALRMADTGRSTTTTRRRTLHLTSIHGRKAPKRIGEVCKWNIHMGTCIGEY